MWRNLGKFLFSLFLGQQFSSQLLVVAVNINSFVVSLFRPPYHKFSLSVPQQDEVCLHFLVCGPQRKQSDFATRYYWPLFANKKTFFFLQIFLQTWFLSKKEIDNRPYIIYMGCLAWFVCVLFFIIGMLDTNDFLLFVRISPTPKQSKIALCLVSKILQTH